jgi:hypothetical protein
MPRRPSTLPLAAAVVASATALAQPVSPAPSGREVENVAAFARLYGVVRFFYPSDAAAELDWDRFAVHGVARVRPARDAAELASTLRQITAPLGPGIEIAGERRTSRVPAGPGEPLVAWRYLGPGFSTLGGAYAAKRTNRAAPPRHASAEGFATLMQTLPAEAWRGKTIRLSGRLRAPQVGAVGGAALWLRVDRENQKMGFFDNMSDRMVRGSTWTSASVEGPVADDALAIAFGVMAVGDVTGDFDEVELAVRVGSEGWTPVPIADGGFEAPAEDKTAWSITGSRAPHVDRPHDDPPQGKQYVRLAPPQKTPSDAELIPSAAPRPGAHAVVDLGSGLSADVALALSGAAAAPVPSRAADLRTLQAALAAAPAGTAAPGTDERLADVVVCWSVLRHFYPYWTEAGVDWEARLAHHLEAARTAADRAAQADVLRGLVADVRDGHGFVADPLDRSQRGSLPIGLGVVEGRLVVVSSASAEVPVGAVVTSIDGVPAEDRLAREVALASGSTQWRQARSGWALASGPRGSTVSLGIDDGRERRVVRLACDGSATPPMKRPAPVGEIEPGLFYVDLTRAKMADVAPRVAALAAARAVVFDVRGYPTDAGAGILPHLLDAPETDRWMHVARIVGPFFETAGWQDFGWDVKPATPRIAGKVVFLTDGTAISYAESVMGYVGDRKLGTIVGSATAGTNGNVASFRTPGGFNVGFTGMLVTRHDGRSPHHLVGVKPDVAAAPTIAGLRAGRDEVLERALEVVRGPTAAR